LPASTGRDSTVSTMTGLILAPAGAGEESRACEEWPERYLAERDQLRLQVRIQSVERELAQLRSELRRVRDMVEQAHRPRVVDERPPEEPDADELEADERDELAAKELNELKQLEADERELERTLGG
jgi:hypothetical protein